MSMRVSSLVTHLGAHDALTVIEFIDQLRDMLIETYGDQIRAMLHEASLPDGCDVDDPTGDWLDEDEVPF
jgi:hypothetical protein